MVTKAGARKEEREKQSRIKNGIAAMASIVTGLVLFSLPRIGSWIVIDLSLAWLLSLYCAWHCWSLPSTWPKRFGFTILHALLIAALGFIVWPRIKVSPPQVKFLGFPNETFNFSARNERSDDVYDVQIPFLVGYNKRYEDKLSAKVIPNGDPPQALSIDYNYCFGKKGDGGVKNMQRNEREVLIVRITHIAPNGSVGFTITYAGGEKLNLKNDPPTFAGEPFSYSPTQGEFDVRGDYRTCKVAAHANRLAEQ